eukprot:XP_019078042.1 PREDICTED: uncharacterized protein LOC100263121 isoform X3 [Vitis vinifera]
MADQGGSSAVTVMRDYRKGNWTVNETMILIEAKKMDDQRRMKRSGENEGRSKPAELRWKWVEDYCWRKGCLRSQNQCNDKWDNLMRDYKKVRDYERRLLSERGDSGDHDGGPSSSSSYWMIDKNERKEKNLPSNMLRQIYEGLVEVVERKGVGTTSSAAAAAHQRVMSGGGGGLGLGSIPNIGYVVDRIEPPLPPLLQHHNPSPVSVAALPPPPPLPPPPSAPQPPQQPQQPHIAYPQPLPSLVLVSPLDLTKVCSTYILNMPLSLAFMRRLILLFLICRKRCVIAQILIQVSIQTHQQSGGEEVVEKAQVVVLLLQVEAPQLKWVLQFQKVLPL